MDFKYAFLRVPPTTNWAAHLAGGARSGGPQEELSVALHGHVAQVLADPEVERTIRQILEPFGDTEFDAVRILDAMSRSPTPPWKVGEAIAEAYLTDWRSCLFPWPMGRDARHPRASLPGPDLVGFATEPEGERLVFGQVKTSSQEAYPPSIVYGASGLRTQLQELRDSEELRGMLIGYLAVRSRRSDWQPRFIEATQRYLADPHNFRIYGVLVRDVLPDPRDLRASVKQLAKHCPLATSISLLAIYVPIGEISRFAHAATDGRRAGS